MQCSFQNKAVKIISKSRNIIYKFCWQILEHFKDTVCFFVTSSKTEKKIGGFFFFFIFWCFGLFSQVHWNVQKLNFRAKNTLCLSLKISTQSLYGRSQIDISHSKNKKTSGVAVEWVSRTLLVWLRDKTASQEEGPPPWFCTRGSHFILLLLSLPLESARCKSKQKHEAGRMAGLHFPALWEIPGLPGVSKSAWKD